MLLFCIGKIGKWSKGISPKKENPYFATKKNFPGKTASATFYGTLHSIFLSKIRKKLMKQFCTKSKNPIFRQFLAQICPNFFFFENRSPSHFEDWHFTPLCQKSEKTNEPFPRKAENRKMVKGNFPKKRKSVFCDEQDFSRKNHLCHILTLMVL